MDTKTAIIIPVHNEEAFIADCLDHISRQTVMPDSVVLVNNHCTDGTLEICRRYPFVEIIDESTQGICASTKRGLDYAAESADILLRCDADSMPGPSWVQKVVQAFANQDVLAVTGPGSFYGIKGFRKWCAETFYMRLYFFAIKTALRQRPLFGSNFAIRADVWKAITNEVHLDRQDIHDDIEISYHVAPKGKILYDSSLVMPISSRPFTSLTAFLSRFPMGVRSVVIHWPKSAPWRLPKS